LRALFAAQHYTLLRAGVIAPETGCVCECKHNGTTDRGPFKRWWESCRH
jgi:hypothetical protein